MTRWTVRLGGGAIVIALAAIAGWSWALHWRPSDQYRFQGIDLNETSGTIDWWAVKRAGAEFAYLRATSGSVGRDTRFEQNWTDAAAAGLRHGATHLYSLCRDAVDQANNFNTTVPRDEAALPAALELDFAADCAARPAPQAVRAALRRFLAMAEAHTGKPVLLKVSKAFDAAYGISQAIPRPVWAVQNFFPPAYPAHGWRMWQASDLRRIEGVAQAVHWDVVAP